MSSCDALLLHPVGVPGLYSRPTRSQSVCTPSSSCEALRGAVAALHRLDDFHCEKIGAGFFSEVFKVQHRASGQVMVLKMNTSPSNRANSLREVQLMNRLSHPNILKFMGVCVNEGQLHALTEFINGGSLEQLLQDRRELPWGCRILLSLDVARGMDYLHSRGVFHRDLTSKNVLIKIQGDVMTAVVGDFGLAEKIPDRKEHGQRLPIVGSPYWMAPECLKGEWYNEKADVFSYGIILCEIIARIEADPDILPRTENFGVDYVAFSEMCPDCPPQFLEIAFTSCRISPDSRPSFQELVWQLEKLLDLISCHDSRHFLPPVLSCNDKDEVASVRAIFTHGWHRSNLSQGKVKLNKNEIKIEDQIKLEPVTPKHVGEAMLKQDPYYKPNSSSKNPFASLPRFWKGKKFVESSASFIDVKQSLDFSSPSRQLCPTPDISNGETLKFSIGNNRLSKSLPTLLEFPKKKLNFNSSAAEFIPYSPGFISPGPSFSPPSSFSPFETDETFSGYSSVQEQMSDCKLEDSSCIQDDKICLPPAEPYRVNTPVCAKLRRSSGESGFFSVGDRNSACDFSFEQMSDYKMEDFGYVNEIQPIRCNSSTFGTKTATFCAKLRRSSGESGFYSNGDQSIACELSLEGCHVHEDISHCSTVETQLKNATVDKGTGERRRKRPSSSYSDDSCSCNKIDSYDNKHDTHSELIPECGNLAAKNCSVVSNHHFPAISHDPLIHDCNECDSCGILMPKEFPSHVKSLQIVSKMIPGQDCNCCENAMLSKTCKNGKRVAKCMRTSPDL